MVQAAIYRRKLLACLDAPPAIYIETTSACNLNCVMCPTQRPEVLKHKPPGFIDIDLLKKIVDEIQEFAPFAQIRLHKDGEPLLHPQIIEIIDYTASRLPNTSLVTNATLLSDEMSEAILNSALQDIRFSIDGLNKSTYEKVRQQSSDNPFADNLISTDFDSVIRNVLKFCELRKSRKDSNIKVGIRIVDFKPTADEISDFKAFWEPKVEYVEASPFLNWSGTVGKKDSKHERYPCLNLWSQMVINWDGSVVPCCVYVDPKGHKKGIIGDTTTSSVLSIWKCSEANRLRQLHLLNNQESMIESAPYCVDCADWRSESPPGKKIWSLRFKRKMNEALSP